MGVAPVGGGVPAPPPGRPSMPSLAIDAEPTVLVVGDGFEQTKELERALAEHGIYCETATRDVAEYTAVAVAPDIVLLVGDAAREHYESTIATLRKALRDRMPPIAVVTSAQDLSSRLDAFVRGAVAAFSETDAPPTLAKKIDQLIKELAERGANVSTPLGETSLEELLGALSQELRAQLISDSEAGSGPVRLVLGGGKPLAIALREFVGRLKRHVVSATPLPVPDVPPPAATEPAPESRLRPPGDIAGLRAIVADEDAGRADVVAQALRERGAEVLVTNFSPSADRLARLRRLDPSVLLAGDDGIPGRGLALLRAVRDDYRLRWASLIVLRWEEVWPNESEEPAVEAVLGTLTQLTELEHSAVQRARAGLSFHLQLESIGPIRLLRALEQCVDPLCVSVHNARLEVEVDLADGEIERVVARPVAGGAELTGVPALSALSVLHSGRVEVDPRERGAPQEPLGSVRTLLGKLDQQRPPVPPSMFPEAPASAPEPPPAPAPPLLPEPVPAQPPEPPPRVALGPISIPAWVVIVAAGGVVFLLILLVVALSGRGDGAETPVPAASAPLRDVPTAIDTPPTEEPKTLIDRARAGDATALKTLEAIPVGKRTHDQAFALAYGMQAKRARDVSARMTEIAKKPAELRDRKTQKELLAAARDPITGAITLRALAGVDAPEGADLIYEVWTGTPGQTPMTELAESLVFSEPVRKRASPALAVALDLRSATTCDAAKPAVERALDQGDRRALRPLAVLLSKRGCGPKKADDCWPCLRGDDTLQKALAAVRRRKAPL